MISKELFVKFITIWLILSAKLIILNGCIWKYDLSSNQPNLDTPDITVNQNKIPFDNQNNPSNSKKRYPPPSSEEHSYPPPVLKIENDKMIEMFLLDTPLTEGDEVVSGKGPSGTLLEIVDITMNGEILGTGIIGENNEFLIHLPSPLKARRLIGIRLNYTENNENFLKLWELRGPNAKSIPGIGYFLDSAMTHSLEER